MSINKPTLRVLYEYRDHGTPALEEALVQAIEKDRPFMVENEK
jgi:hypothetical protein